MTLKILDSRTFRSSINSQMMKKKLMQGTAVAAIGVTVMVLGAIFLPEPVLAKWGLWIFFFSFGCLAIGLIPYRRLKKLEKKPNEIIVLGDQILQYWAEGKKILTIPQQNIRALAYRDNGICLYLRQTGLKHDCDFFFPYFSQRTFHELQDILSVESAKPLECGD